jgi:hypothetical protein
VGLKKILRDSRFTKTTDGQHQLVYTGEGTPEEVARIMEKKLGRKVAIEIEEICWCGCGQPVKAFIQKE